MQYRIVKEQARDFIIDAHQNKKMELHAFCCGTQIKFLKDGQDITQEDTSNYKYPLTITVVGLFPNISDAKIKDTWSNVAKFLMEDSPHTLEDNHAYNMSLEVLDNHIAREKWRLKVSALALRKRAAEAAARLSAGEDCGCTGSRPQNRTS